MDAIDSPLIQFILLSIRSICTVNEMYVIKRYVTPTHNIKNTYAIVKLHTSSTVLRLRPI